MERGARLGGRFEIEQLAGEGGMGCVYRARDAQTGATVAVKVLREVRALERFTREARLLAELNHPGIVRYIHHDSTSAGDHFLVMEWLEGEDLHGRLLRGELSVAATVALVGRVAETLAVVHAHGVVHRDIKPRNLFLPFDRPEAVKLLDFGIASLDRNTSLTRTGAWLGTPGYASPEQVRGARDVDARADLFALGCVLFRCLAGRDPFAAADPLAVLMKTVADDPPRVGESRDGVPDALDDLLAQMLAKVAADRPRDARTVANQLAQVAQQLTLDPVSRTVDRPTAVTANERRVQCMVVARMHAAGTDNATDVTATAGVSPSRFAAARAAVERCGGTLECFADGALLVRAVGPGTATDRAVCAARCALALRTPLGGVPIAVVAAQAELSGRLRLGDGFDRAAELLARAGARAGVLLDDAIAGLLDGRFEVGGSDTGFELRAERDASAATRTLLGKPTRCVGRDRELAFLAATFDECAGEPAAHAVVVTGAAGVGKSRVRYEFLRSLQQRGGPVEVWLSHGDPTRAASPFGLIAPLLRRVAGILDGEPAALQHRKLRARAGRHADPKDLPRLAAWLGELAGLPRAVDARGSEHAPSGDAIAMGDQMRQAWEAFVRAECAAQPLVIVLEDLHWGDWSSVRLIDATLRNLRREPLMVLAMARPDVDTLFPSLWNERRKQVVRLSELSRGASEQLVRATVGDRLGEATVTRLVERADGNAFYLEELIRAAAEDEADGLPATVLAMAQSRLERLEADARRVLRAGSVFGQAFWRDGVGALLGGSVPAGELAAWLERLVDTEVVTRRPRSRFPDDAEYVFRHALVRDAAYAMLPDGDRAQAHRRAGEWLERGGEPDGAVLAEHFERGGDRARAAAHHQRAAEDALEGTDFDAVVAHAERAVACGARGEALGMLRRLASEAQRYRGRHAEAATLGREAMEALAPGSADWYRAAREVAISSSRIGDDARVVLLGETLCAADWNDDASGAQVVAAASTAERLLFAGRLDAADALYDAIARVSAAALRRRPEVAGRVYVTRGTRALCENDPGAALPLYESAAAAFDDGGELRGACNARGTVGYVLLVLGAHDRAEHGLRHALADAERLGLSPTAATAKHNLGWALACAGEVAEARVIESEAVDAFVAQGDQRMEGGARMYLAAILAMAGELDAAGREGRTAIERLRRTPNMLAYARGTLAGVLLAQSRTAEALDEARGAMDLLESLGDVEEGEATVRLAYAEALFAAGRPADARSAIAVACARLGARAAKIRDAAWRASYLTQVPAHARARALARAWGVPATEFDRG